MGNDLRYAARTLRKHPGFTSMAALTLCLGIGANSAIFSLMNAVVFRPLRLDDPDRVVVISERQSKRSGLRSPTMASYVEWRKHNRSFEDIARGGFSGDPATLSGLGRAQRVSEAYCTANFLSMLHARPLLGRTFLPEDNSAQGNTAVVMSESLWRRTFGADPSVLGQTVALNGRKKTIIGILPSGFSPVPWNMNVDVWTAADPTRNAQSRWLMVIGRLKPGVTAEQAQAELDSISRGLEQSPPEKARDWGVWVLPLHETFVGGARQYFYLLLGAVGFLLLIACANVANLVLARAVVRQKEIAIRASLGAGRWRLARQVLAEGLLLGLLGGALGVLAGIWGMRILLATVPFEEMRTLALTADWRVIGFTLGVSALTAVIFSLLPALRISNPNLNETLKEAGRQASGVLGHRERSLLLVCEVALAMVLLVGAGLMMNSFLRLQSVELGFNPKNVLRADVFLDGPKYMQQLGGDRKRVTPQATAFYREVLDRIQGLPGVVSAGIIHLAPPSYVPTRGLRIVGRPAPSAGQETPAGYHEVSAGIFRTLEIPLLRGRYLTARDAEGASWAVVINQTMARRFFPNEDPIGKQVQVRILGGVSNQDSEEARPREIVGVIGDVRHYGFGRDPMPIMYGSYQQHVTDYPGGLYAEHNWKSITIRAAGDPISLVAPLQKIVAEVDKDQALFKMQSIEQALSDSLSFERFQMRLFSIFGALALLLAAVGIYGVVAYLVSQRTHEIGVRVALGASRGDVLRLVIGGGLKTTLLGLAIGMGGSLALTRLIGGFLFGLQNTDPATYLIVALVLTGVALAACYVPGRRATKVDPLVALRHE